jgi:hypothetical protein
MTFVLSVFDTFMQPSELASATLKTLLFLQWISIGIIAFATFQLVRNRISLQLSPLVKWILAPTALLISTILYRNTHNEELLKQRISQTWHWQTEKENHTLTIDAVNRSYTYSAQTNSHDANSSGESPEPKNFRELGGNTSVFKMEEDVLTKQAYYSLYLFDFPEKGFTCLVSIDGVGAPKLYLNNNQVVDLR